MLLEAVRIIRSILSITAFQQNCLLSMPINTVFRYKLFINSKLVGYATTGNKASDWVNKKRGQYYKEGLCLKTNRIYLENYNATIVDKHHKEVDGIWVDELTL